MLPQIKVKNLEKSYGGNKVLKGIDLAIEAKKVHAIIGPNGAGKTTAIEIMLGIRDKDEGNVEYVHLAPGELGVQLQNVPLFPSLTVKENIELFSAFYRLSEQVKNKIPEILHILELTDAGTKPAGQLSGGQKKRLSIALAILHEPKVLFLDEPTADLDPRGRMQVRSLIRKLANEGKAVVITSHDMDEVAKTADQVFFIKDGKVIDQGSPESLLNKFSAPSLEAVFMTLTEENGRENDGQSL
ncbi:ABC transporter ATP-binding protein [Caldibacillus debilis]|uniref:ABC transporter domain-containing protein n=1 Tax=Caldibacillus debilis TaxID=301148 RepID=A0A150MCE4_9BACI|nr:ABC transporter ATP-binding protein [Caldibacillus debilis]KYD21932.1 hypothetical protein B4135_1558 [Caldibacillus debilis]